ncbi:hypothetical protein CLAIMM_11616 [Cladophialophora immunda]|nr:hypothetical protein CLAIMM_11616 [Cladophialophora immunda]
MEARLRVGLPNWRSSCAAEALFGGKVVGAGHFCSLELRYSRSLSLVTGAYQPYRQKAYLLGHYWEKISRYFEARLSVPEVEKHHSKIRMAGFYVRLSQKAAGPENDSLGGDGLWATVSTDGGMGEARLRKGQVILGRHQLDR